MLDLVSVAVILQGHQQEFTYLTTYESSVYLIPAADTCFYYENKHYVVSKRISSILDHVFGIVLIVRENEDRKISTLNINDLLSRAAIVARNLPL